MNEPAPRPKALALALLSALAQASCVERPPASPAITPRLPPPVVWVDDEACRDAVLLVEKAREHLAKKNKRCAGLFASEARARCSTSLGADDPLTQLDEAQRAEHSDVTALGPWFVEYAGEDQRIWSVAPGHAQLRARLPNAELSVVAGVAGNVIRAESGEELLFVDPATQSLARVPRADVVAEGGDYVFTATDTEVRRLRLPKLEPAGVVAWKRPSESEGMHAPLRGGAALAVVDTLVAFDKPSSVATGFSFLSANADQTRLLACDPASHALVDLDAVTYAVRARVTIPGAKSCVEAAAYAPDPRFAFWLERGPETKRGGMNVIVRVADFKTGKVSRFDDAKSTWSIALHATPYVDGARLCAEMSSFHGAWKLCNWKLDARGRVTRDAIPTTPADAPPIGPGGAIELGRAALPSGERLALRFHQKGDDKSALELAVTPANGKERLIALEPGTFFFDDNGLREAWRVNEVAPLPRIAPPIDVSHVVILPGIGSLTDMVVDIGTGAIQKPCDGRDDCHVVGRYAADRRGLLIDILTGAKTSLDISDSDWAEAADAENACR
jgi:hypothetical protein